MKHNRIKSAAVTIVALAGTVLFIVLTVFGNKDGIDKAHEADDGISTQTIEEDGGIGTKPDINTDTGTNPLRITPGGIEYSFIDTSDMTAEEIAALEKRLDEEAASAGYEPDTNVWNNTNTRGMYVNRAWSCTFLSGGTLHIGIDGDDGDALYLNPVYIPAPDEIILSAEETSFAFYIRTVFGDDVSKDVLGAYNGNYIITGQTLDTIVPADGTVWRDLNNFHGYDGSDYDIGIRVMRLPDGQMMGTARLHIAFDSERGKYSITALYDSDVSSTGELSAQKRSDAVEKAFAFFRDDSKGQSTFVDTSYWEQYRTKAKVEKVDLLYFPRLFDASGEVVSAGKFSGMDVFAVNINYPGYGCATIYLADQAQIYGMRDRAAVSDNLQPFAYDAFKPFTQSTLFVPDHMKDEFYG